ATDKEPERRHRVPTEHQPVERVHAIVRLGGGVRGFAQEFHIEVDHGKHERVDLVAVAGVIHKCGVDALECAALHEVDLATATLLRGATDESHAAADAIERVTDGEEGS